MPAGLTTSTAVCKTTAAGAGRRRRLRPSGPTNADYQFVQGGDGFVCRVDPKDPDVVYSESQNGNMFRRNLRTGEGKVLRPKARAGSGKYRFNWNTPFLLSSHNSRIFYAAANYVFRSVKKGEDMHIISPEITRTKHGSATALAESPKNPDVLWVGTDDGAVWLDARRRQDMDRSVRQDSRPPVCPGRAGSQASKPRALSRADVTSSLTATDPTTMNRMCSSPRITANRGNRSAPTCRQAPRASCVKTSPIPTCSIWEPNSPCSPPSSAAPTGSKSTARACPPWPFTKSPNRLTANEIVAATHGRSLWVLDVTTLRQLRPAPKGPATTLYMPNTVTRWQLDFTHEGMFRTGTRHFVGQNPTRQAVFDFYLASKAAKASLKIVDPTGNLVRELDLAKEKEPGMHRIEWDLVSGPAPKGGKAKESKTRYTPLGQPVKPGAYIVVFDVDGTTHQRLLTVEADPRNNRVGTLTDDAEDLRRWMRQQP